MENQETIDYIRKHLAGGHSEDTIRQHFLNYGWPQSKVDTVFAQYRQSETPKPAAKPQKVKGLTRRPQAPRWSQARRIKTIAAVLLIVILAGVVYRAVHKAPASTATAPPQLTYRQKQTIDINIVGGAVGQYAAANSVLPTRTSSGPDGSILVLCNDTCDPTTSQVASLSVYKPADVKVVAYAPGMIAPNAQSMYLVPGAKCAGSTGIGGPSSNLRSMVILYNVSSGANLTQRCVTL